jgi:pilus assembly protein CpaE
MGQATQAVGTTTLVVVDLDPMTRDRIAAVLGRLGAVMSCRTPQEMQRQLAGDAGVVVFGPSCADRRGIGAIDDLAINHPGFFSILLAEHVTTDLMRDALRAGVRDVVTLDGSFETQLSAALDAIVQRLGAARPTPPPPVAPSRKGRIISVVSAKGGVGKSVVAANLAVALRSQTGTEVAIIDGDLQFGDVPVMMRLVPQYTIVDAVEAGERLDAQMLRSLLTRHELSGVLTLAAPSDPRHADHIKGEDVVRIAKAMADACDYVVIDTPPQLNDISLSVMEVSDEVVLVTSADIANVKNVKIALEVLGLLGIGEHKAHLVMNRAGSKAKLDLPAVERTLRTRVSCHVPSSVVVPESVNRGVPVVLHAPKSSVARAFEDLAQEMAGSRVK